MTPCPRDDELLDLVSGRGGPTILAIESHFESCAACQTRIATLDPQPDSVVLALRKVVDRGADTVVSMVAAAQDATAITKTSVLPGKNIEAELAELAQHWEPPARSGELGRLGRYILRDLLGAGGMGVVVRAEDTLLHREVALKVVRPRLVESSDARSRFLRESQAMAAINSEHVIPIYDGGHHGALLYYTMPLLSGEPLDALIRREGRVAPERIRAIALDISKGLAVVHARGVVHRDLKPSNVWLDADTGRARLLDFGLARLMNNEGTQITSSDMIAGTPSFMAPEQARGQPVTTRSDLFSLGCVMYAMATGQSPFKGPDLLAVLSALASVTPAPLRNINPQIPAGVSRLVDELLAKDPEQRPVSASAVVERLTESGAAPAPVAARYSRSAVAGMTFVLASSVAGWWFWPPAKPISVTSRPPPVSEPPTPRTSEPAPSVAAAPTETQPAATRPLTDSTQTSATAPLPGTTTPDHKSALPAMLPYLAESSRYGADRPVTFATYPDLRVVPSADHVTLRLEGNLRTSMPVFRKVPVGGWNHSLATRLRTRGGVTVSLFVRMQPRPGAAWFDRDFAELKIQSDGQWFLDRTYNSTTEQIKQRLAGGDAGDPRIPVGSHWVDLEFQALGDRLRVMADGQILADVADPVPIPTGPVLYPCVAEFKYDANAAPPEANPELDVANLVVRDDSWSPGPGWREVGRDSFATAPPLVPDLDASGQFRRQSAGGLITVDYPSNTSSQFVLMGLTYQLLSRVAVSNRLRTRPGCSLTWMVRNRRTASSIPDEWDHFYVEVGPQGRWIVRRSVDRTLGLPEPLTVIGEGQCPSAHDDRWHDIDIVADPRHIWMRWDGQVLFDLADPHPPRETAPVFDVRLMATLIPGREGKVELDEWRVWTTDIETDNETK